MAIKVDTEKCIGGACTGVPVEVLEMKGGKTCYKTKAASNAALA